MYFFKISSQFCSVDQSPFSRILFHMRSSCYQKTKGDIKNARRPTQSLEGLRSEIQNWETELFKELPALELSKKLWRTAYFIILTLFALLTMLKDMEIWGEVDFASVVESQIDDPIIRSRQDEVSFKERERESDFHDQHHHSW